MPIFDPQKPRDMNLDDLRDLTTRTRESYQVHELNSVWGNGSIYSFTPNPATGNAVAEIFFFRDPSAEPKDGDMIVFRGGKVSMIFDVEHQENPADLWRAHCVSAPLEMGIGHPHIKEVRAKPADPGPKGGTEGHS